MLRAAVQASLVVEALLVFYPTKGIINSFYSHKEIQLAIILHNWAFPSYLAQLGFLHTTSTLHILKCLILLT
jgi:hypothetical protein